MSIRLTNRQSYFRGNTVIFNEIMALIMPSIIGVFLYSKISKKSMKNFELIGVLVLFTFVINNLCYAIMVYLSETTTLLFTITFTLKYSLLALLIAIIISFIYRFIELNIEISLRVESKHEKDN